MASSSAPRGCGPRSPAKARSGGNLAPPSVHAQPARHPVTATSNRTWFLRHVPLPLRSVKTPNQRLCFIMVLTALFACYFMAPPPRYITIPEVKVQPRPLFGAPNNDNVAMDLPRIMMWTSYYGDWYGKLDDARNSETLLEECAPTCRITNDRRLIEHSDAVIFHVRDLDMTDLPPKRFSWQRWVFFSMEPPPHAGFTEFHFTRGMFNWTMTYRRDSDAYTPYGRIVPRDAFTTTAKRDLRALWKSKNKTAVWMVSRCNSTGGREHFVAELRKYMDVDVYGACGDHECNKTRGLSCYVDFERTYFYALAFENSICVDYVTEKFYNAIRYDIIPVVFGGANYSQIAPHNSYIDALSFESPEHLAKYLIKLSKNYTEYAAYHTWKDRYYVPPFMEPYCELCEKLQRHAKLQRTSFYGDIKAWWFGKSNCRSWVWGDA